MKIRRVNAWINCLERFFWGGRGRETKKTPKTKNHPLDVVSKFVSVNRMHNHSPNSTQHCKPQYLRTEKFSLVTEQQCYGTMLMEATRLT